MLDAAYMIKLLARAPRWECDVPVRTRCSVMDNPLFQGIISFLEGCAKKCAFSAGNVGFGVGRSSQTWYITNNMVNYQVAQ